MLIYKILRADEWTALQARHEIAGAPADLADGFVHFSTAAQVRETAAKHFAGSTGLQVLACESAPMGADLVWEASRGGALFPHLYRPLRITDVAWAADLPLRDGQHVFPDNLA